MRFWLAPRSMTLDDLELYKFEFSENFAGFRTFRMQQKLNKWRYTRIVSDNVVSMSNWSNFGMLSRRAGLSATAGLSCFPSVLGWILTCKTVSQITYTVLVETLNHAQSINTEGYRTTRLVDSISHKCLWSRRVNTEGAGGASVGDSSQNFIVGLALGLCLRLFV